MDCPSQHNSSDCGVYAMAFGKCCAEQFIQSKGTCSYNRGKLSEITPLSISDLRVRVQEIINDLKTK